MVANSILAGSKFSNAYARNMLHGILEEVQRAVVRVDWHVDDFGARSVAKLRSRKRLKLSKSSPFAFDRLSLVISPMSTICCSDVKMDPPLRRGLLELGILFGVTRRARDLGVGSEGGARRAVGVERKRLCKAAKPSKRLGVVRRHTKKSVPSPWQQQLAVLQLWGGEHGYCAFHHRKVSDRALRTPRAPSLVGVSRPALPLVCLAMRTRRAGVI